MGCGSIRTISHCFISHLHSPAEFGSVSPYGLDFPGPLPDQTRHIFPGLSNTYESLEAPCVIRRQSLSDCASAEVIVTVQSATAMRIRDYTVSHRIHIMIPRVY